MKFLLHGISRAEPPTLDEPLLGVRRQPLARIEAMQLAAFATCWATGQEALGRADLLAHHELLEQLHWRHQACLPVRFPTWFESEDDLRSLLQRRADAFNTILDRIRGRVELAITVLWTANTEHDPPDIEQSATSPGRSYLLRRQHQHMALDAQRARARELARAIERIAGVELIEAQHSTCPRDGTALSTALLLPRNVADKVAARLRLEPPTAPDVRILVSGPWPPYTFAVVQAREA